MKGLAWRSGGHAWGSGRAVGPAGSALAVNCAVTRGTVDAGTSESAEGGAAG